ncbi:hypothetical protein [Aggregatibacter actinomycetemcomitans]|uniref:hypothetical protein n=1 Tax=Aggregatibacter actinomycetemcomitans TaxID=714 RepID=UPI001651E06D|nr:hypothetical protein [Aggregatibacter actinomycetemcomitans]
MNNPNGFFLLLNEYAVKSMPEDVQAEIAVKTHQKSAVQNLHRSEIPAPQRKQLNYLPEALWIAYDKATQKKKEKAEHRFKAVCAVTDLVANGTHTITALVKAGERFGESWKTIICPAMYGLCLIIRY